MSAADPAPYRPRINPVAARYHSEHVARLQRINSAPFRKAQAPQIRLIANAGEIRVIAQADAHVTAYRIWIENIRMSRRGQVTVSMVLHAVEKVAGFKPEEIVGQSRKQPLTAVRQLAMKIYRDRTQRSHPEVGRRFGNRDHTTVLHACRRIEEALSSDERIAELHRAISEEIDRTLAIYDPLRAAR